MTKQRALMLSIFRSDACIGQHRTADEIFLMAREKMPGISRATVYNNLRSMEEEGLIRRISAEGGADMYDASFNLHGHLFCTVCHSVKDVMAPDLLGELCELAGERIDSYELKLRYVCERCRAAEIS